MTLRFYHDRTTRWLLLGAAALAALVMCFYFDHATRWLLVGAAALAALAALVMCFNYSHDRATRWRLLGAVALSSLVMYYRFHLATVPIAMDVTQYAGYWLVALTAITFVVALQEEVRAHWPGWKRVCAHWPGLLAAMLIAGFWQVHEPHDFKILFDEHVLGGIARLMHYERQGAYAGYAHYINGHLSTFGMGVDKRPLMYPFLVSILHDLTGFRPENSFVANGLISFVLLLFIYGLGVVIGGWRIGCLGQMLLAGLPLIAQNATSGGFDLLNVTAITGFVLAAWNYWRQTGTGGLDLCVYSGLVLANCRYESLLFLGVVMILAVLKWIRERRTSLTLAAALSPPLALPPLLLNLIFMGGGGGSYFQTKQENFLNVSHLGDNIFHAGYFLFLPDWHLNSSILLSVAGFASLLLTLMWILRRLFIFARESSVEVPFLFCVLGVLAVTFITLLSFWGFWDDPPVQRLSLPLYIAFAWCVMYAAARSLRGRTLPGWVIGAAAICAVVTAAPVSSEAYTTNELSTYITYRWARDYVLKHADPSVLIVSRASVMFTLYGLPNIHLGIANHNPYKVFNVVQLGLYREVWVVQEYTLNGKLNAWVEWPAARLDQRILLKTIAEDVSNVGVHVRISKIVGYDATRPAGVRRLAAELDASTTEQEKKDLGGDYVPPTGTEAPITERPADEPPAFPTITQLPADQKEFNKFLGSQYPMLP